MDSYGTLRNWQVVDDRGEFWDANGVALREALFCIDYGTNLMEDIVRNLGFIGLRLSHNTLRIKLNHTTVSTAALSAVIYCVADLTPDFILLDYAGSEYPNEIVQTAKAAVTRLCELSKNISQARQIKVVHFDLSHAACISSLSPIVQSWTNNQGKCNERELRELANRHAGGRYSKIDVSDGEFTIAAIGNGMQIPLSARSSLHQGQRISDQRDEIYFSWVASTYRTAIESGRPDFANISASIYWPEVGWSLKHYSRLLLPCIDKYGKRFLFLTNIGPRQVVLPTAHAA
jgi:hypothetical protein